MATNQAPSSQGREYRKDSQGRENPQAEPTGETIPGLLIESDKAIASVHPKCPKCESDNTVANGSRKLKNGTRKQRYVCRDCGKSF